MLLMLLLYVDRSQKISCELPTDYVSSNVVRVLSKVPEVNYVETDIVNVLCVCVIYRSAFETINKKN